jgi:thymidylate synthase
LINRNNVDFKSTLFLFIKKIGDEHLEIPRKSRENYNKNRRKSKKQLEEVKRNPKKPAKSSTERSRECRERQKPARQEAFHPSSTLEPQPSASTAQIEPEQQELMEIDDIDQNFQLSHRAWNTNVHRHSSQLRWIMNVLRLKPLHSRCILNLDRNKSNKKKSTLGPRRISKFITRQLSFAEYFNDVERVR